MNILQKVKLVVYLLQRYRVDLSITQLGHPLGTARFNYTTRADRLVKVSDFKIYVNWADENAIAVFLHELGHLTQIKRAATHGHNEDKTFAVLYSERRASLWAVRVAKLLGLPHKDINKYLCNAYETYTTSRHYRSQLHKDAPIWEGLADTSYNAVKLFGVTYD